MFSFRTTCILFTLVNYVKVVQWPRFTEARILYSYTLKKNDHVIKCIHAKLNINCVVNVIEGKTFANANISYLLKFQFILHPIMMDITLIFTVLTLLQVNTVHFTLNYTVLTLLQVNTVHLTDMVDCILSSYFSFFSNSIKYFSSCSRSTCWL